MLKIAAIAFDPLPGDVEGNLAKIKQIIKNSQHSDIDLLVFPEGALVGYPLGDMVNNKDFLRRVKTANTELMDF
jgi:predicted amidohydrolase